MIDIYGKDSCVYCDLTKEFLSNRDIEFNYFDVSKEENKHDLLDRNPDAKTLPQIWMDDVYVGGYSELVEMFP